MGMSICLAESPNQGTVEHLSLQGEQEVSSRLSQKMGLDMSFQ
jgi:hypothetical protein